MNLKTFIKDNFSYIPKNTYNFTLAENMTPQEIDTNDKPEEPETIFPSLKVNLDYLKTKYNLLINSDISVRNFIVTIRGKQYKAFVMYIDGMINSELMDNFVIKPLMLKSKSNLFVGNDNNVVSEALSNNISIKKVKKFNLDEYVLDSLLPQNSVETSSSFNEIILRY